MTPTEYQNRIIDALRLGAQPQKDSSEICHEIQALILDLAERGDLAALLQVSASANAQAQHLIR